MPSYNYEEAIQLRKEGYTNKECADHFGYSGEAGFRRRHKRELKARAKASTQSTHSNKKNVYTNNDNNVHTQSNNSAHNVNNVDNNAENGSLQQLIQEEQYKMEELAGINTDKLPSQGHWSKQIALPKYGEIEPSLKRSTLNHHDWGIKIWGKHKFRWDLGYLKELEDGLWSANKEAYELPRFHGKTETVIKMGVRETVEKVQPYLMITNKFLVKRQFRMWTSYYTNRNFRLMYGDIVKITNGYVQMLKSNSTVLIDDEYFDWQHKDPLFQVISREQEAIGGHPAHMHIEDIIQQMPKGEDPTESLRIKIDDDWFPMLSLEENITSRVTGTWTRKELGDIYEYIVDEYGWNLVHHKAVRGVLPDKSEYQWDDEMNDIIHIDPAAIDRMDLLNPHQDPKGLLRIALKQPTTFASQYQNDPIARGNTYFNIDEFAEIKPFDISGHYTIGVLDSALGEKASDFSALIFFLWYKKRIIIFDLFLEQNIGFDRLIQEVVKRYKLIKPDRFICHADRSDLAVYQTLRNKINLEKHENRENKMSKIDGFKEYTATYPVYYFSSIDDKYKAEMIKQVLSYDRKPSTPTKHDDFLDALVTGYNKTKHSQTNSYVGKTWSSKR